MTDTLTPVLTADWADEQSWKLATYARSRTPGSAVAGAQASRPA
jgi:hypothetical protein